MVTRVALPADRGNGCPRMNTLGTRFVGMAAGVASLLLLTSLGVPFPASAEVLHAGPADYRGVLRQLASGDVLELRAGTYRRGLPLRGLRGRVDAPVVIRGPRRGKPAVFGGRAGHNTVSLANNAHLVISDLVIEDGGHFVDAVKAEGFRQCESVHHVTLERLVIRGHRRSQQQVGISTKCPAWGWIIRDNVIVGAGTGIYLGDSDGNAPFVGGLIEGNRIEGTLGYNLQIKHQLVRPVVAGIPQGQATTIIRRNVFSKAAGSGDDRLARPNVLVGHPPLSGPGRDDEYLVYGNVFYGNPHEALFQGEGNIALYNNVLVNLEESGFPAVAIQPHNWVPKRVHILFNTVIGRSAGIRVSAAPGHTEASLWGNAVFAAHPLMGMRGEGNYLAGYGKAGERLRKPFASLDSMDPCPLPGRLKGAGTWAGALDRLPEGRWDYRGRRRSGARFGACEP